jgi:hypothetical protein
MLKRAAIFSIAGTHEESFYIPAIENIGKLTGCHIQVFALVCFPCCFPDLSVPTRACGAGSYPEPTKHIDAASHSDILSGVDTEQAREIMRVHIHRSGPQLCSSAPPYASGIF